MKTYETYKDSGIEWLGQIPGHWEIVPMKRCATINNGKDYKHVEAETGYPVIGSGGQFAYASEYLYNGEALLLGRKGTINRPIYINGAFWTVDTMFYAVPRDNVNCKYLYYQSLGIPFDLYSTSTALPSMTQTDLGNNPMCLPPISEQEVIASYLDYKIGQVDLLIAEKEKQMKDLQQYRMSLISETVTHGLNPDVKMKESGVEWLGRIPEHWEVLKMKYLVTLQSGSNLTAEQIQKEGQYPVYGGNGIRGYYHSYSNDGEFVLIGRQGALCGNINYATGKFWATEHAVICYPIQKFALTWFGELLRTMNLNQYSESAAQPGLSVENIKKLLIPVPPLSEQQSIASFLDDKTARIDSTLKELEMQIADLRCYKTSVITEAVTGKVDVRQWKQT